MNLASLFRWRHRRAPGAGAPGPVNPPGEAERLLRRLDFTVIRRLDGLRQGDHRNAAYGAGLDLAELRPYQPGDDVRALDWNVTARMGEAYVRRYNEDRDVTAWLVLDLTASTDFGSAPAVFSIHQEMPAASSISHAPLSSPSRVGCR